MKIFCHSASSLLDLIYGESVDVATATVAVSLFSRKFDMGDPGFPLASGYILGQCQNVYSAQNGVGWDVSAIGLDWAAPDALKRDFCYSGGQQTFSVDVPNGTYDVRLLMGTITQQQDSMRVAIEGTVVASSITQAAGTWYDATHVVTVSDGQMNLTFSDMGGSNPYWVVNAIEIAYHAL